jgi:glyoxylase-like metal-dependent hydrolase (beta-lactamase superfamily II)
LATKPEYPIESPPAPGQAIALGAGGVHWVRLPLPGSLRHINVWLLEDGPGWTLIDTGMDLKEVRAAWEGPLDAYLCGRPLRRILLTHHHPDHAGLAAWLSERHGAPVYMSAPEARLLKLFVDAGVNPAGVDWRVAAFERDGIVATEALRPALAGVNFRSVVSGVPRDLRILESGVPLDIGGERWDPYLVRGHTDGQIAFHAPGPKLLISGDQVLPRITSNIGIYPEREDKDPIASFLGSFDRLAALDPEPLVLPSHGEVFRGLRARLADLRHHHAETLDTVVGLLTEPSTARDLASRLFKRPLDSMNLVLAVGETLANLEHLARAGRAEALESPGMPRRFRRLA